MTDFKHKFVEQIPEEIEEGTLYISIPFETAIHKCCCGCLQEVVTPLSPTDWSLTFDGETVSLSPSIGNWSFPCKSHYFIRKSRIRWARKFSNSEIEEVKENDSQVKVDYFNDRSQPSLVNDAVQKSTKTSKSYYSRLKSFFRLKL